MRILVKTSAFKRAFKKFVKSNPRLEKKIEETIQQMQVDPFAPFLATHKLGGKLSGILACSCGYDCRILFTIENDTSGDEIILLLSIGTHEAVY